uniref:anoctamin-1-like n=1 Tax=Myxine glutinosa TaxID=7769 RepID=UPI00358F0349
MKNQPSNMKFDETQGFHNFDDRRSVNSFPGHNLVMFSSSMLDWLIPDVPEDIAESIRKEQRLVADCFLRDEQEKHNILQTLATQKQDQREQLTTPSGPLQDVGNDSPILKEGGGMGNPVTHMMEAEDISPENNSNDSNNLFTNNVKL